MGYKRVETLGDVARYGLRVKVTCGNPGCGRTRRIFASDLYGRFSPTTKLRDIGEHLVCLGTDLASRGCGHRGATVDFIIPEPPTPAPPDDGGGNVVAFFPRLFGSQSFWDHAAAAIKRRRRG